MSCDALVVRRVVLQLLIDQGVSVRATPGPVRSGVVLIWCSRACLCVGLAGLLTWLGWLVLCYVGG